MTLSGYHYELPKDHDDRAKVIVDIARTELLSAAVQIVRNGGETNLHAHTGEDAVWVVLGGQVAFYGEDESHTVLKQHDVIVLPAGTKYWFGSVGDEPLEILRVGARDPRVALGRVDVTRRDLVEREGLAPHLAAERIGSSS